MPRIFTEHGAYAAALILRSPQAKKMSVEVVPAFVKMRHMFSSQDKFNKELVQIKSFLLKHSHKADQEFKKVWNAIDSLTPPPASEQRAIGFRLE